MEVFFLSSPQGVTAKIYIALLFLRILEKVPYKIEIHRSFSSMIDGNPSLNIKHFSASIRFRKFPSHPWLRRMKLAIFTCKTYELNSGVIKHEWSIGKIHLEKIPESRLYNNLWKGWAKQDKMLKTLLKKTGIRLFQHQSRSFRQWYRTYPNMVTKRFPITNSIDSWYWGKIIFLAQTSSKIWLV